MREKVERVNVGVAKLVHQKAAHMAQLFERDLQDVVDEALLKWIDRNAPAAQRRVNQIMGRRAHED